MKTIFTTAVVAAALAFAPMGAYSALANDAHHPQSNQKKKPKPKPKSTQQFRSIVDGSVKTTVRFSRPGNEGQSVARAHPSGESNVHA